jgi:hypothetical protein
VPCRSDVAEPVKANLLRDVALAEIAAETSDVLPPVEIGIHSYFFRLTAGELVEPREIVGMGQCG